MKLKTQSLLFTFSYLIYLVLTYIFYNNAVEYVSGTNLLQSILVYLLFQPVYIFLIYANFKLFQNRKAWKRIVGSIASVFAFDIPTMPRNSLTLAGFFIKLLDNIFPHTWSMFIVYVPMAWGIYLIAMELFGKIDYIKKVKNGEI